MTTKGRVKWVVLGACTLAWVGFLTAEFAFAASNGPQMSPQIHGDVIALLSLATLITTAVMVGDWATKRMAAPMDALRSTVLLALEQTRPIYQLVQPPVVATATVNGNGHGGREEVEKRPALEDGGVARSAGISPHVVDAVRRLRDRVRPDDDEDGA